MEKIGFVFSGQGSQSVGMGKDLAENFEVCKNIFDKADTALGYSISSICFDGPKEELDKTENTQPAILTVSIAAFEALKSKGVRPYAVAGLSLGEYSALVASGVIAFEDAVRFVKKRGFMMQNAVPAGKGKMAAVLGLDAEKLKAVCAEASSKGIVECANFNCPGQIVIGGETEPVDFACEKAKEAGAKKVVPLAVSVPSHTSVLRDVSAKLAVELSSVELKNPEIKFLSNVKGGFSETSGEISTLLADQVMKPVLWQNIIEKMIADGITTIIEVGPGKVLSGFNRMISREIKSYNVEDVKSLEDTIIKLGE
ncbi:MAG: ACP S-malonyltransferase [Spirochaetes bacterium]|nr:ACP S-malonyltransferase [Spirochaetota bacterium]